MKLKKVKAIHDYNARIEIPECMLMDAEEIIHKFIVDDVTAMHGHDCEYLEEFDDVRLPGSSVELCIVDNQGENELISQRYDFDSLGGTIGRIKGVCHGLLGQYCHEIMKICSETGENFMDCKFPQKT